MSLPLKQLSRRSKFFILTPPPPPPLPSLSFLISLTCMYFFFIFMFLYEVRMATGVGGIYRKWLTMFLAWSSLLSGLSGLIWVNLFNCVFEDV